ncbi:MAG TPA: hypothetical protein VFU78_02840 [Thermomicrobiales bacterium]|nr:hypothetical protein [Thermomicrobiales bacterium]
MTPYAHQVIPPIRLTEANLGQLVGHIRTSRRPVIWVREDVRATFAHDALAELAQLLEAPVIRAGDAAGVLPDTHPLAAGQSHGLWRGCSSGGPFNG